MQVLRRDALALLLFSLAVACSDTTGIDPVATRPTPTPTPLPGSPATRPNIVLIVTDDADVELLDHMPKVQDLLVEQGTFLPNFLVSLSSCCPSRVTMLRGQYAHSHRVLTSDPPNGAYQAVREHNIEASTVATWLQSVGYRTALVGKYLNAYPKGVGETYVPPGWSEWYALFGSREFDQYKYTINENGTVRTYGNAPADYGTDVLSRKALDFIRRSNRTDAPFFLFLAPHAPHWPAPPAPRHATLFSGASAPRTAAFAEEDVSDKPAYIQRLPRTMEAVDSFYRKRLRSMQAVDDMVEDVVRELERQDILDQTYIFFTSDNGMMMGQHRIGNGRGEMAPKRVPYEESIRVSMIVRGPGVPKGVSLPHLTGNVDLAPTFADLARVEPPYFVEGRSLVPLLGDDPPELDEWRQAFLIEYWPGRIDEQSVLKIPRYSGIRTQYLTYVEYATGERELYDLSTDPLQLQNVASITDRDILDQLSDVVAALKGCRGAACREAETRALPALISSDSLRR